MNGNRNQQYHSAQQFVDDYLFGPGPRASRPSPRERITAAELRIQKSKTPSIVLHKQQRVIDLRTEMAEAYRTLTQDDTTLLDKLRLSNQRHQYWLAHELRLRKVLNPPRAINNSQSYEHRLPTKSDEALQCEESNDEDGEEAWQETVEATASSDYGLSRSIDATIDDDDSYQLFASDISDMMDLILKLQMDMTKGNLNIAAGQLVCETAWKRIEAYEAELQLISEGRIAEQVLHRLRVRRLKDLPFAKSVVKELIGGELRSKEAISIDATLRLIPKHQTAVPPIFASISKALNETFLSNPPKPTKLILYIGILLVRDTTNLWTARSRSQLRTALQQTRDQVQGLVSRFLQILSKSRASDLPSQELGVHRLANLLEGLSSIPTDLHHWWYSFWIMIVLTPLTSLCRLAAADPFVMRFLHMYLADRVNFRNSTLDSFCKVESPSFPAGIPSSSKELIASYTNYISKPVAYALAMKRSKRSQLTADELISQQCHIGGELLQILQSIAKNETKSDDITDCDILKALKKKLIDDLDIFPNTIDLSYTLHKKISENQQPINSIEDLRLLIHTFNIQWVGFLREIRSPKLGDLMVFSWEEFLKTEKSTFENLFAILASVSHEILKSVRSARNTASGAKLAPPNNDTRSLWNTLLVRANGSIDNLPSYLYELELLTQNSPYFMAAAIQDFMTAIYSWIPQTQRQAYDFRSILCDGPGGLLNQVDNSVKLVEMMVAKVKKARIDISQYVLSRQKTLTESPSLAKRLAAASIDFLIMCLEDGSIDSKHASDISNTAKLISKCFKIEDRKCDERTALLDIYTNYEKQRAEALCGQGNSSMKMANFLLAIQYYTAALQFDPENPRVLCNRSIAYSKIKHKERARFDAKRAVQVNPNDARAHSHLGFTELHLGNPRGSLKAYLQAIELLRSTGYHNSDQARRKADKCLINANKGLEKAKAWLIRFEGASAARDAELFTDLKSTPIQSGGLCIVIELPFGFRWYSPYGKSSCGQRLVREIPREQTAAVRISCDTRSSPMYYFYTDYNTSKDVLHYFLTWLSFTRPPRYPPIKSLKFDTSQNVSEAMQVVEEILANSIVSKDCSVLVNSTPYRTITIPSDPSYLLSLSKYLYNTGVYLLKEKDYDGAIEYFYSAISALEDINPPLEFLIVESIENRSQVLETHITTANYTITEGFVNDTYTLATVPWHEHLKLDSIQIKKLQHCMLQCAVMHKEWDCLSRAKEFTIEAVKLYGHDTPAERLLSDIEEMLKLRKEGHFPRLKSLEYGKMTKKSEDPCSLCQKHVVVGSSFDRVRSCSHLFHHTCLSKHLSEQFSDAPTQIISLGGKLTLELRCPTCFEKIDYSSLQKGHFLEWAKLC